MNHEYRQPFYQAELGISVRKVSNGYSIKINHSMFKDKIGQIIVTNTKQETLDTIGRLFDECEKDTIIDPLTGLEC